MKILRHHDRLLYHIRTFCESTSIKGVPRITISPTRCLGTLWLLAVLFCAAACFIQVYDIVQRYVRHPRVTLVKEEQIDITNGEKLVDLEFPHIVICNLNLMSADAADRGEMQGLPQKYYHDVMNWTTCSSCTEEQNELLLRLRKFYFTIHGFYAVSDQSVIDSFTTPAGQLIASCKALVLLELELRKVPCEDYAELSMLSLPNAYNCVNIKNKSGHTSFMPLVGFEFVMYLDDRGPPIPDYFNEGSTSAILTGGNVIVYKPGTIPLPERDGIYLAPGYHSDIKLSAEAWKRLPPPYSKCSSNKTVLDEYTFDGNSVRYNVETCLGIHTARAIESECGCRDSFSFVTASTKTSDLGPMPQCISPGEPHLLADRFNCSINVRGSFTKKLTKLCHESCRDTYYQTFTSQTQWVSQKYLSRIYREYVENRTYAWRFNSSDRRKLFQQVKDNFVSLKVMLSTRKYIKFQDEAAYSASYMISSLGGALNLWLGITVILILEVIDYILKLFLTETKPTAPSSDNSTQQDCAKTGIRTAYDQT